MQKTTNPLERIEELIQRYPLLAPLHTSIADSYRLLESCYENHGKLLVAGNGGSASDAEHIVGELMKEFSVKRKLSENISEKLVLEDSSRGAYLAKNLAPCLRAISLNSHPSLNSAVLNDVDGMICNAQQVLGYGDTGDVFLGISTSGNSENIILAAITAKAMGLKTIALTGQDGGKLAQISNVSILVPETETYRIQELHLPIYHCLCLMLEECFFGSPYKN